LEGAVERGQLEGALVELVELLGMSALSSLDRAVEFRASRGEQEELDVSILAGFFESGGELAAAVDLECPDWEGHSFFDLIEKGGGRRGGGTAMGPKDVPTGDNIARGEVLEYDARQGPDIQSVQLDQVTGYASLIFLGFSDGVGA
jgi:hypothetical protein